MTPTTYQSTAEHAAEIRQTLKQRHGWTSRQVSVKSDTYSMGSSIDVLIKDPTVDIHIVKAVAGSHESIHRCEITGEILGGGNQYVHVAYSREALAVRAAAYLPAVEVAAQEKAYSPESSLIPIAGTKYYLGADQHNLTLWSDTFLCQARTAEQLAQHIACLVQA